MRALLQVVEQSLALEDRGSFATEQQGHGSLEMIESGGGAVLRRQAGAEVVVRHDVLRLERQSLAQGDLRCRGVAQLERSAAEIGPGGDVLVVEPGSFAKAGPRLGQALLSGEL